MERTTAIVNLKAIQNNLDEITNKIPQTVKRFAVIKANAYGHGAVEVAKYFEKNNVTSYFAVATFNEALELRENGINGEILVLGYIPAQKAKIAEEKNITISIGSVDYAEEVFSYGFPNAHLQIDTGMSRLGIYCHCNNDIPEAISQIKKIQSLSKGKIKGIYTHFLMSDIPSSGRTELQFKAFTDLISSCEKEGIAFEMKHCCNSAGAANFPQYALDAVRIGIGLYGYECDTRQLTPAMTFKAKIIKIFEGKKGDTVSYCGTHTLEKDTKIAVCSCGYADGVTRQLSNKGHYFVNGKKANILGRVCMDLSMIDVSKIECKVGDEAIIFGDDIPVSYIAQICGTNCHEILCNVSGRVPREYI